MRSAGADPRQISISSDHMHMKKPPCHEWNAIRGRAVFACALPFLSEVREPEALGGLVFLLAPDGGDDQHDDRDDVGEHLVELLVRHAGGDEQVEDVQPAEEDAGEDGDVGTPDREDDQRDGQPAAVAEGVVAPHAAGVVHDVVQTAEARDHAADAGRAVLVAGDVQSRGVRGGRALADGAEVQAEPRPFQHEGRDQGDGNGGVSEKAVAQEDLPEPAERVREAEAPAESAEEAADTADAE